jgi:hypothetical protein
MRLTQALFAGASDAPAKDGPAAIHTIRERTVGGVFILASAGRSFCGEEHHLAGLAAVEEAIRLLGLGEREGVGDEVVGPEAVAVALEKLEVLEKTKPAPHQLRRYAAVGAVAAPTIAGVGNIIQHGNPLGTGNFKEKALRLGATAVTGALPGAAMPALGSYLDRRAEKKRLAEYMKERQAQPPPYKTAGRLIRHVVNEGER